MREVETGQGLTPLGRELLLSHEEAEKQKIRLAELNNQLDEINACPPKPSEARRAKEGRRRVKIEELKIKMKARKFVFSGEVYLRR